MRRITGFALFVCLGCSGVETEDIVGDTGSLEGDTSSGTDSGGETSGTTATTTTTTSATSTTAGFVQVDGGIEGGCVPGKADDCPDMEKCSAYVMEPGACCVDTNICVPIIGDKQFGDDCTRTEMNDDCDNTLFCMSWPSSGSTGDGTCLQFCEVADPAYCANAGLPSAQCISFNDGVLPLCEDTCDPLLQDCDGSWGCYAVGGQGFTCTLPGHAAGEGGDGSDCYTVQSCMPGLLCADGTIQSGCQSDACCTNFCEVGVDNCSDPMEECVAYFEPGMELPGYETVGLCAIPA
jgi:hypothetical protein